MRLEIREFRIPIVLTVLMICVITYWTWQTWNWLDGHDIDRARHEAYKMGWPPPQGHMPTGKFIEHVIIPFVAVVLLLCANAAAWTMVIRNRALFEQLEIERAKAAHLEELGLAAAGLAHETKNPLGIISGIAQQVARDPGVPEKSREQIEIIVDEIDKSVSRLGLFMTFAGRRTVSPVPVDAARVVEGVAAIMAPEFDAAGITLDLAVPNLSVLADEQMFRQILVNLLMNSLTASSPGESVTIRLTRQGRHAVMEVRGTRAAASRKTCCPEFSSPMSRETPKATALDWPLSNALQKILTGA